MLSTAVAAWFIAGIAGRYAKQVWVDDIEYSGTASRSMGTASVLTTAFNGATAEATECTGIG